jgi:hypothetical protein
MAGTGWQGHLSHLGVGRELQRNSSHLPLEVGMGLQKKHLAPRMGMQLQRNSSHLPLEVGIGCLDC